MNKGNRYVRQPRHPQEMSTGALEEGSGLLNCYSVNRTDRTGKIERKKKEYVVCLRAWGRVFFER